MDIEATAYGLPRQTPSTNRPPGGRSARQKRRISPRKSTLASLAGTTEEDFVPPPQKRRSGRGSSSLWDLARFIKEGKQVVFITGAGLSAASGVPLFRTTNDSSRLYCDWKKQPLSKDQTGSPKGKNGLVEEQPLGIWNSVLWTQAKKETFRKEPLSWWNDFWLSSFPVEDYEGKYDPNAGHLTLAALLRHFPDNIKIITQNVDGLSHLALDREEPDLEYAAELKENIIEAHGRLGLYRCLPAEDSDTDSSSDEDDDRMVHLGHRRKYRAWLLRHHNEIMSRRKTGKDGVPDVTATDVSSGSSMSDSVRPPSCRYQMLDSLTVDQLSPQPVQRVLTPGSKASKGKKSSRLTTAPCCPSCGNHVLPLSLLFDEGYHSHEHYSFTKMEDWLAGADVLVFVGTSFAVTLPLVALDHAKEVHLPVFNFNLSDMLTSNARLNAENIAGPSQETLPRLWQAVQYLQQHEND